MRISNSFHQPTPKQSSLLSRNDKSESDFDVRSGAVSADTSTSSKTSVGIVHRFIDVVQASDVVKASPESGEALKAVLANVDLPSIDDDSLIYATLSKGGKTIATLYKDGQMMTPGSTPLPSNLASDGSGKALADKRLTQMLNLLGGEVQYRP